jgi:hypothetical protein
MNKDGEPVDRVVKWTNFPLEVVKTLVFLRKNDG